MGKNSTEHGDRPAPATVSPALQKPAEGGANSGGCDRPPGSPAHNEEEVKSRWDAREHLLADVARILCAAGWRDTCDAQWTGLEAALPELKKAMEKKR